MFKFLKEKLDDWTKKLKEKAEEKEQVEEPKLTKEEKKEEKKKLKEEKKIEKAKKKEEKSEAKKAKKLEKSKEVEEKPTEEKEETTKQEIELPKKFNVGTKQYEPDLEKFEEIKKEIEKKEAEEKPGTKSFFQKITSKINKITISEKDFKEYEEDLEMILLENNVALEVAEKIIKELKEKIVGEEILKKELEFEIKNSLREIIEKILVSPPDLVQEIKEKNLLEKAPYVILFCGINGSGKTTTIAKVASFLQSKKISCVAAAGDTFRAASIEQLKEHGKNLGMNIIAHEYGSDPASVGFDAIQYAKKQKIDCVLIDTAGRMHTQKNLLREMEKIVKVCKPDKKIFIGESITGNDSVEQVKSFDEAIGIDGIILTKADIDEKGGTALSLGYITKKPILFLGVGQEYNKLEQFDKNKFVEKLGL